MADLNEPSIMNSAESTDKIYYQTKVDLVQGLPALLDTIKSSIGVQVEDYPRMAPETDRCGHQKQRIECTKPCERVVKA